MSIGNKDISSEPRMQRENQFLVKLFIALVAASLVIFALVSIASGLLARYENFSAERSEQQTQYQWYMDHPSFLQFTTFRGLQEVANAYASDDGEVEKMTTIWLKNVENIYYERRAENDPGMARQWALEYNKGAQTLSSDTLDRESLPPSLDADYYINRYYDNP